jgi:thiol-disulfide isomerase/thioredoxin
MRPKTRRASLGLAALLVCGSFGAPILAPADVRAQSASARPWLGVAMDVERQGAGARVGHVIRSSPADRAGIREGDRIVRVESVRIAQGSDVIRAIATHGVGDVVEIGLVRAGSEQSARVTLSPFPAQDDMIRMDLVGTFAPDWKDLATVHGSLPSSVGGLRGRVVVLDFWATWCGPCRVFIPKLGALQARYGAQGLSVVGVSTEDAQEVGLFAQHEAMTYAVAVDKHGETTRSYGVFSLPTVVVIDKRGVVRDVGVGYDPSEDAHLDATVRSLLAEPAPSD